MRFLTVCAGNICRSAMAEYLLRQAIVERAAAAGVDVSDLAVSSAGTLHIPGKPIDAVAGELLAKDGIDASAFRSTTCTPALVNDADVVLCFEREQLESVLRDAPQAVQYAFLIEDFANLCTESMRQGGAEGTTPDERLESLIFDAPLLRPLLPAAQEIPDPHRRELAVYEAAHDTIKRAASTIAAALVPTA